MHRSEHQIGTLRELARAASENAYAPYSKLRVGAVVIDDNGNTYSGCNVESASYGLTQCAERNALGAAIAAGVKPGAMHMLLVYSTGFETLSPCGACRQVMSELLSDDARIIASCADEHTQTWTMNQLFPDPFILE